MKLSPTVFRGRGSLCTWLGEGMPHILGFVKNAMEGKMKKVLLLTLITLLVAVVPGCNTMEGMVKPEAKVDTGEDMGLPPYSGPRAKVAVADFDWKVGGGSSTTVSGFGGQTMTISHSHQGYTTGLRDMLTTALVQSKRYRVLERQQLGNVMAEQDLGASGRAKQSTAAPIGQIEGAELLVMGAVTGWDPATSGTGGGVGGGWLGKGMALFGAAKGAMKKSSMAMDIRIVDARTSEVLDATRVEGVAKDVNLGGFLGGFGGSGGMAGGLSGFAKTPMEKAIRTCLYNAVKYVVENTPQRYMKY